MDVLQTVCSWLSYVPHLACFSHFTDFLRIICNQFNTRYVRCDTCAEVSHVFSHYFTKQISRVLCCFTVKAVTLQNTKGFFHEEMNEITSQENSRNCKTCVGDSCTRTFFSWSRHEMRLWLFCKSSVAILKIKLLLREYDHIAACGTNCYLTAVNK